jgi:prophage tail gpP-like protein
VTVQGFCDPDDNIWDKNKLIDIYSPKIFNDKKFHEYLICEVAYSIDLTAGTTTTLLLRRKDAYLPEPMKIKTTTEDPYWARIRSQTGSKL